VGRQNNASVETDSFESDSKRRDITINSFGIDYKGRIVDYQNGLSDLRNSIIRAVGDPKERFMEDATRILRVFRFAAKMGFDIEEGTKNAAIELKHLLSDPSMISVESISKEFYKVAKSGNALANFLVKLQDTKILHDLIPEFTNMEGMMHNKIYHPEGGSTVLGHILECLRVSPYKDPVINLGVMFHDFGKAVTRGEKNGHSTYHGHEAAGVPIVERIFKRLKFGELAANEKTAILDAVNNHMLVHKLDELNIKTLTKLILNPSWNVIKAVGFCDEASRGSGMFNKVKFEEKIQRAESKVQNIGGTSPDAMRKTVKKYIDGNKIMQWFPEVMKNMKIMKDIVASAEEFIMNELEKGNEPSEQQLKNLISVFFR
jgi:tRNA nucleotidyltransferase/poly(A) polymerase